MAAYLLSSRSQSSTNRQFVAECGFSLGITSGLRTWVLGRFVPDKFHVAERGLGTCSPLEFPGQEKNLRSTREGKGWFPQGDTTANWERGGGERALGGMYQYRQIYKINIQL